MGKLLFFLALMMVFQVNLWSSGVLKCFTSVVVGIGALFIITWGQDTRLTVNINRSDLLLLTSIYNLCCYKKQSVISKYVENVKQESVNPLNTI